MKISVMGLRASAAEAIQGPHELISRGSLGRIVLHGMCSGDGIVSPVSPCLVAWRQRDTIRVAGGYAGLYLRGGQVVLRCCLGGFVSAETELWAPFLARLSKHAQSLCSAFRLKLYFSCGFSFSFDFDFSKLNG